MAVGEQTSEGNVNSNLTQMSLALRDCMRNIQNQWAYLNGLGLAGLETLGFDAGDAQLVLNYINYMQNVAGCYYGTIQQGGTGGSGAILFDFEQALIPLWGGS